MLLIEAIAGAGLEPLCDLRYEDDPAVQRHRAGAAARARPRGVRARRALAIRADRPAGPAQGANITPVVRRGYLPLAGARPAPWPSGTPTSRTTPCWGGRNARPPTPPAVLGEAILAGGPFDPSPSASGWTAAIWDYTRHVTEWTNAAARPARRTPWPSSRPPADDQAIADEVCDNFAAPERNWAIFGSPQGAAAFLARFRQPVPA